MKDFILEDHCYGQIVEEAAVSRLFSEPRHPYTRGLMASMPGKSDYRLGKRLTGSVVDLTDVPTGCRFAARCELAHDRCSTEPPWVRIGDEGVRCWLFADESGPISRSTDKPADSKEVTTS